MIQFGDDNSKLNLQFEEDMAPTPGANIKVLGVGGAGGNAVDRMIEGGVTGVDFIVANTDAQALRRSKAGVKIQIGAKITKGLGAGAKPEIGREAALEDTNSIIEHLEGADMVFVTAGLGGGTGTGAAPIIASLATELGSLVVAVVTTPFRFEGPRRRRNAESGLQELKGSVDTVITIANDKLLRTVPTETPFTEAFRIADDVLRQAVQGISDLINVPGVINLDFADIKTIMEGMGVALMGSGTASGENRAMEAAQLAISSPLLEDASVNGARGVLLNIVGGPDLTMNEINDAATLIQEACDPDAEIIFGAVTDEKMTGSVRVTVIATGFTTPSRDLETPCEPNVIEYHPRDREHTRPTEGGSRGGLTFRSVKKIVSQPVRKESVAPREPAPRRDNAPDPPFSRRVQREPQNMEERQKWPVPPERKTEIIENQRPLVAQDAAELATPDETIKEVLMAPQNYGANNLGFEDENDLDIPTYLRNMRRMKGE